MKVNGHTIEQDVIDAAIARMKVDGFKAREIAELIAKRTSLRSAETAMRAADRVIQAQRQAGNISFGGGYWAWCGK